MIDTKSVVPLPLRANDRISPAEFCRGNDASPAADERASVFARRSLQNWSDRTKALVLLALVALIYGFGLGRDFYFDDILYISDNPLLSRPDALRLSWFSADAFNYYPLFWSLLRVQWLLWGNHPFGYQLVALLGHGVNAILLWKIARQCRLPGAWYIAALFALHPVNVQTVAWAAEQKNTWSFLFMALASLAFIKHAAKRDWRVYTAALVCFVAALACKTSIVCLPLFLAICCALRREKTSHTLLLQLAPFFIASLAAGLTTIWFEQHRVGAKSLIGALSIWQRVEASGAGFWFYAWKAIAPIQLTPMYRGWVDTTAAAHGPLPAILLVLLLAVAALSWRRFRSIAGLGVIFYALMLLPLLGFFDTTYFIYSQIADHWQYHALPGLIVTVVCLAHSIAQRARLARYSNVAGLITVAGAALLSTAHFAHFENARTLWRYVIAHNPDAWIAWYNLGNDYADQREHAQAIDAYRQSLRVKSDYVPAHFNLANSLAATNRFDEADGEYAEAEKISPTDSDTVVNRAVLHLRMGRTDEAIAELQYALKLEPHKASAEANLARIYRSAAPAR